MTTFRPVAYKAMNGYFVRVTWPDGSTTDIDNPLSPEPQFRTEQEALAWIADESENWLRPMQGVSSNQSHDCN